jgi:D-3-phosphoglycerate dehydrogenase
LTRATRGLIGRDAIAKLKPGSIVLNVARGGIVDETALADALRSGHLGGAGVDVFSTEPPTDSPLLDAPGCVLTPHLGASTSEAQVRVAEEAAQQVIEVLAGRPARHAVNAPLLTPETADALAPYLPLAQTLGQLYAQFARGTGAMTLEVAGELAGYDAAPLAAAALRGVLEIATAERVTLVNAPQLARARGIKLVERKTADAGRHASLITLEGAVTVGGTVAADGEPRLVRLGHFWLDMTPSRWMLITRHHDRPGTIGRIGLMLGDADVNISEMHLARRAPREDAFMILAVDEAIPDAVAEQIRELDAVVDLWVVHLGDVGQRTTTG